LNTFSKSIVRHIALLLVMALAFGPIGCGVEEAAIPTILMVTSAASAVAFTIHQCQEIEEARLDIEMKRLRLQGMRDGMPVTFDQMLTDEQCRQIQHSGKVKVNGKVLVFRPE
jgi:hypothetical protein